MNKTSTIPATYTNGQMVSPKNGKITFAIHIAIVHGTRKLRASVVWFHMISESELFHR